MKKKKIVIKTIWVAAIVIISFSLLAFLGIHIAYTKVFSRADYSGYDKSKYLIYNDVSSSHPRKTIKISSRKNKLSGYIYVATPLSATYHRASLGGGFIKNSQHDKIFCVIL